MCGSVSLSVQMYFVELLHTHAHTFITVPIRITTERINEKKERKQKNCIAVLSADV